MSVLKVKQGDEWVSIMTGGGGSADINQIPADWNQNDIAAPNYIRNRTHYVMPAYEVATQVIPRDYYSILEMEDDMGIYVFAIPDAINGDPQAEYVVTIDGVEYKETLFSLMGMLNILGDISILSSFTGDSMPEFSAEKPYVLISAPMLLGSSDTGFQTIGVTNVPPANGNSYNVGVRAIGRYNDREVLPKSEYKIGSAGTGVIPSMFEAVPGCTYRVVYDDVVYNAPATSFSIFSSLGGGSSDIMMIMLIMSLFGGGMDSMNMSVIGDDSIVNLANTSTKLSMPKYPFSIISVPMLGMSVALDFSPKFPHLVRLDRMIDDVTSEVILPMKTRMGFKHPVYGFVWDCGEVTGIDTTSTYRLRDSNMNEYTTTPYVSDDGIVQLEFLTPDIYFIYDQETSHLYYTCNDYNVTAPAQTHTIQIEGCTYPIKKLDAKFLPNGGGMNPLMMLLMGGLGISTNTFAMPSRSNAAPMTVENEEQQTKLQKLGNVLSNYGFGVIEANPLLKSVVAAKSLM